MAVTSYSPRISLKENVTYYIDHTKFSLASSDYFIKEKFLKDYVKIDEGILEYLPSLGFKKQFSSLGDLERYVEKKFGTSDVKLEEVKYTEQIGSSGVYTTRKDYVIKVYGKEIASFDAGS